MKILYYYIKGHTCKFLYRFNDGPVKAASCEDVWGVKVMLLESGAEEVSSVDELSRILEEQQAIKKMEARRYVEPMLEGIY